MTTALLDRGYAVRSDDDRWTIVDEDPGDIPAWQTIDDVVAERQSSRNRLASLRRESALRVVGPWRFEREHDGEDDDAALRDAQLRGLNTGI